MMTALRQQYATLDAIIRITDMTMYEYLKFT